MGRTARGRLKWQQRREVQGRRALKLEGRIEQAFGLFVVSHFNTMTEMPKVNVTVGGGSFRYSCRTYVGEKKTSVLKSSI